MNWLLSFGCGCFNLADWLYMYNIIIMARVPNLF